MITWCVFLCHHSWQAGRRAGVVFQAQYQDASRRGSTGAAQSRAWSRDGVERWWRAVGGGAPPKSSPKGRSSIAASGRPTLCSFETSSLRLPAPHSLYYPLYVATPPSPYGPTGTRVAVPLPHGLGALPRWFIWKKAASHAAQFHTTTGYASGTVMR